jgi:hypothetical protein
MRGQLSLPALGLAFLVLTTVVVLGVTVANGALASADRDALDRQAAVTLSDRLVSADGPLTTRQNVIDESALANITETTLRSDYGLANGTNALITLDGTTLVSTGSVDSGRSIERLVVVRERQRRTLTPSFAVANSVTLPRRTDRVRLAIRPGLNRTVSAVRVGDRVVLQNSSGLRGTFTLHPSRYETAAISFESNASLSRGTVRLTYYPIETEKAQLGVTVDG